MASGQHPHQNRTRSPFKCVVIGDACVGKTWLVARLADKPLDGDYIPTILENQLIVKLYKGQHCTLDIWDTAGQEDYGNLRPTSYDNTDLFVVCFSLVDPTSFENLETVWLPEMNKYKANARVLIVGTKSDLYKPEAPNSRSVPRRDIDSIKSTYGHPYAECSSLSKYGIPELLQQTLNVLHSEVNLGRKKKKRISERCDIL